MTRPRRLGSAVISLLLSAAVSLLALSAPALAQPSILDLPLPDTGVADGFVGGLPDIVSPTEPKDAVAGAGGQVGDTVKDTGGTVGGAVGGQPGKSIKDVTESAGNAIKDATSKIVETIGGATKNLAVTVGGVRSDLPLEENRGGKGKPGKAKPSTGTTSVTPAHAEPGGAAPLTYPDSSGRFALAESVTGFNPGLMSQSVGAPQDVKEPLLLDQVIAEVLEAARRMAFPMLLALLVAAYVIVQNRIDKRDPKLSVATLDPDEDLLSFR